MKNLFTVLLLVCTITVLAQTKETRNVGNFDEVMMSIDGTVYIKMGDKNKVILEVSKSDLEKVETEVRSGRLGIELKEEADVRISGAETFTTR